MMMFVREQKKLEEELIKNGVDYKMKIVTERLYNKRGVMGCTLAMLVQPFL